MTSYKSNGTTEEQNQILLMFAVFMDSGNYWVVNFPDWVSLFGKLESGMGKKTDNNFSDDGKKAWWKTIFEIVQ